MRGVAQPMGSLREGALTLWYPVPAALNSKPGARHPLKPESKVPQRRGSISWHQRLQEGRDPVCPSIQMWKAPDLLPHDVMHHLETLQGYYQRGLLTLDQNHEPK